MVTSIRLPDNIAIVVAAQNGHLNVVQLLLADSRVNPNAAIDAATSSGHSEIAALLADAAAKAP